MYYPPLFDNDPCPQSRGIAERLIKQYDRTQAPIKAFVQGIIADNTRLTAERDQLQAENARLRAQVELRVERAP